jgi:ribosomal protein S12 methylthiotransferase
MEVLIDEMQGTTALARSAADAPEIDGIVRVKGARGAKAGSFLKVRITASGEHDLAAVPLKN